MTDIQQLLAKNLKAIRTEKNLSQKLVSERSGVIGSTYSRIESCVVSPNLSTLEKLAEAMEVPMERFFKEERTTDVTLLEKLERIESMEAYNKQVVEIMIDSMLAKDDLEKQQKVVMNKRLAELEKIRK